MATLEALAPEPSAEAFRLSPQQRTRWRLIEAHRRLPWGLRRRVAIAVPAGGGEVAEALGRLVERFEILRTTFPAVPGMRLPAQEIAPPAPLRAPVVDLRSLPADERRRGIDRLAAALAEPFADREPPLRASLVRRAEDDLLLLALSPLVADRRSVDLLLAELARELAGRPPEAQEAPLQYPDLAEWQNEMLDAADLASGRAFWEGRHPAADSPLAARRPGGAFVPRRLAVGGRAGLAAALAATAETLGAGPDEVLLAAWSALLARVEGGAPPALAAVSDGRRHEELVGALGPFERRLPLLLEPRAVEPAGGSFADLVAAVREARRRARAVEELFEPAADVPAPACGFRWQARPAPPAGFAIEAGDELVDRVGVDLEAMAGEGELDLALRFDGAAFDRRDVAALGRQLVCLLAAAVADPGRGVAALPLDDAAGRRRLLRLCHGRAAEVPARTLPELFDEQARATPEHVAIVAQGGASTTYAALAESSRRLAARLRRRGAAPGRVVALAAERSPELLAALLAVQRTGAAAAVLDPANPAGRLEAMLADCGAPLVLAGDEAAVRLAGCAEVARLGDEIAAAEELAAPAGGEPAEPAAPAYVIFTSGSTGRPKGVLVSHSALVNRLSWSQRRFPLAAGDRVGQLAAIGFDFALFELLGPLVAGAAVALPRPVAAQEPEYLAGFLADRAVSVAHFVPSLLRLLLDVPELTAATALRRVYVGGEEISAELARRFHEVLPEVDLVNQYGPTEATIDATAWRCRRGSTRRRVPIGRPIDNTRAYVLAPGAVEPAGLGIAGELCLAGDGLALGYLGRPAETAWRFRPDPFGPAGTRLYRTGDLARQRAGGAIDFLGRLDHQVQVRGTRIELGEISEALAAHPAVREAAVRVDDEQRLVAYLATDAGAAVDSRELLDHLRRRLPDYMLPTAFVALAALPRSAAGKIDLGALAAIEPAAPGLRGPSTPPRTPAEGVLCAIWSEVLAVPEVGVEDDFFALGGHSLLAMRIVSRARQALGVELSVTALFDTPTVAGLAAAVETGRRRDDAVELPPLAAAPRPERVPLSSAQERLWFLARLDPGGALYNVGGGVELRGALDVVALAGALDDVRARHEVLRTVFPSTDDGPVQVVEPFAPLDLRRFDLRALAPRRREEEMRRLAAEHEARPFDIERGPLFRAALVALEEDRNVLLLALHHVVGDAWSTGVLTREIAAAYAARAAGRLPDLPPLPLQYADYALWQRGWVDGPAVAAQLDHWRRRLAAAPDAIDLPTDFPRRAADERGLSAARPLPAAAAGALAELARREAATPFMALLAAWALLLGRLARQPTVVVGVPLAGRSRRELEPLVGCFINLLPIVVEVDEAPTFRRLLAAVRTAALDAFAHQDLPFEKLVEALAPRRRDRRHPLFQVAFDLQPAADGALALPGLAAEALEVDSGRAKFELMLTARRRGDGFVLHLDASAALFARATVDRLLATLSSLVAAAVAQPDRALAELPWLEAEERSRLLAAAPEPAEAAPLLPTAFAAAAARHAGEVAVVAGGREVRFAELARQVAAVAAALRAAGVGRGDRVAISLPRDERLPAALLGVLAAGAAYVPLDPAHPPARRALVLRDCRPRLLLVAAAAPAEAAGVPVLAIDDALAAAPPAAAAGPAVGADDLAYVLYTSGSTGTPKGVMVTHRGLANYLRWAVREYRVEEGGGALVHSPIGFDLTVTSLFAPLLAGRPAILVPEGPGIEPLLGALEGRRRPGLLKVTPAHLDLLRGALGDERLAGLARVLVIGGDALFDAQVGPWRRAAPATRVINEYGPTETVVGCVVHEVEDEPPPGAVAIGRPIERTRAYVLDRWLRLLPPGLPGELFLAGDGVARGYLGRPALTAERFLPDPFAGEPGARMYRSGDVVRHRPDGALVYLGRADRQAKVRGVRVEPGEVEAALRRQAGVREAVALVRGAGEEAAVVAYVVLDAAGAAAADTEALRRRLAAELPEAMVPATVVAIAELPLTVNGKVDLAALPLPEPARRDDGQAALPPRDLAELRLVALWETLLEVAPVGVEDDFFDLGGHSLLAERMLTRVRRELGASVRLSAFLERPTVRALAAAVAAGAPAPLAPLVALRRRGDRPPLFCVHPLGGDVLCFHELARRMGDRQPFYAFRAPHPAELDGATSSIEEMAASYVAELERTAPDGPVLLAGFSYGSIVAFEMARRLAAAGRPPALLALLDGRAPAGLRRARGRSDAVLLAGLARDLAREAGVELDLRHDEVAALPPATALAWIVDRLREAGLVTPDLDLGWVERFLDGVRARLAAVEAYCPEVYSGAIDLFRSTEIDAESARAWAAHGVDLGDEDKGWGELSKRPLRIHRIPGHHARIVQEPFVGELARALAEAIEAAIAPAPPRR